MCENVNINVSETNETINIVSSEIQEVIDINVFETAEDVTLNITEQLIQVNVNKVTAAEQIQSDWNQTDVDALDFIKNKPTSTSDFINDGEDGVNPFITAADIPAAVTSVGLTMPSAFSVANSPITSAGTLEVTGAGTVSQYVRGDGSLANFPTSTGGGASLSFYLNGSVSQGTIGGVAFREMDRTPILGAGTDFTIAANGYIQSFITDANVPNLLEIPAGNWNFETYFSASSGGGSPSFYLELYKWNGTTLSLIASNSANPEGITNGTAIDLYVSALAVPQTTLLATDRLAVRIYVTTSGRTIKLHTEDNHLCQVITTFSTGITALNGLTTQVQSFATGTSGTDFAISSTTATHTFNLPTASAANRGALSSADWSTFNNKFTLPSLTSGSVLFSNGTTIAQDNANLFWDDTNNRLGIGTATPLFKLQVETNVNGADGIWARNLNTGSLAYGTVAANSAVGGLSLRAHSAAHGAWPNTSMLASDSGFLNGLVLFQNGANPIAFWTNSNQRMRIFSNGNIGIGTTTDAGFKLDVNGTARLQNQLTTTGSITAASAIARGVYMNQTLVAAANSDVLVGLDIAPTFTLGAFTGVSRFPLRIRNAGNTASVFAVSSDGVVRWGNSIESGNTTGQLSWDTDLVFINGALNLGFRTGGTDRMRIFNTGNVGIGTTTDVASSKLTVQSTTQGFLPPRMTTTQKNAIATPAAGLMVYDTTLNLISVYNGTMWISL
jgi:hypothetical protein